MLPSSSHTSAKATEQGPMLASVATPSARAKRLRRFCRRQNELNVHLQMPPGSIQAEYRSLRLRVRDVV